MAMKNPAAHYPHRVSFRTVLLVVLAAVSLLLAQSTWHAYETARIEVLRAESDALRLAESVSSYQQLLLDRTANMLHALGGISLLDIDNPADCSEFLARRLESFPDYENLVFTDINGLVKCSAHSTQMALPSIDRGFAPDASKPLLLSLNRDFLAFVLPYVSADGRVEGMVMASLPATKFFQNNPASPGTEFGLIDGSGKLMFMYPASAAPLFDQTMQALTPASVTPLPDQDSVEWRYVAEPVSGAAQELRLIVRLPADVAADRFAQMAALMLAALAVAGLSLWTLLSQAAAYLTENAPAIDWTRFDLAAKIKRAVSMMLDRVSRLRHKKASLSPGNTTVLQTAYEDLKHSFSQEAEHLRQIVLLDELSQVLQGCLSRAELAERLARCAADLFPGSGGALLLKTAPDMLEQIFSWGGSTHQEAFRPHDCWALRTGHAYHAQQPGAVFCTHMKKKPLDYVCFPLMANGEMLGMLHLARLGANGSEKDIPWAATSIAERTAIALSALKQHERLQFRATRDVLTGLYNRRFMEEALTIEQRRAKRRNSSIGIMMVDVDFFKRFNDSFGHDAGDALLHGMGHILRHTVREGDMPCRYGGEEFVVILPGANIDDTQQRAETLRATIERWAPQHHGRSFGPVTVSIGIAAFPRNGDSWQTTLKAADQALYKAKHDGRNRVEAAPTNRTIP
jgi:diguanylate cyclase (GGDEF)-like protein